MKLISFKALLSKILSVRHQYVSPVPVFSVPVFEVDGQLPPRLPPNSDDNLDPRLEAGLLPPNVLTYNLKPKPLNLFRKAAPPEVSTLDSIERSGMDTILALGLPVISSQPGVVAEA